MFHVMYALTGVLSLPVVRLLSRIRCSNASDDGSDDESDDGSDDESDDDSDDDGLLFLGCGGPGFTLLDNIGDFDPAITEIDLRHCNLTGLQR